MCSFRTLLKIPLAFGFILCAHLTDSAFAQEISVNDPAKVETQVENALSDYNQYPIHAGSFLLRPQLRLKQQYDTNVLATEQNEKTDNITIIAPSINIEKPIRDHEFRINLSGEALRYWDNSQENIENYEADFESTIVVHRHLKIPTKINYEINHKQRLQERTAQTSRANAPLKFKSFLAETGLEYNPNRLTLGLYGGYKNARFDNGNSTTGAPVIREDGDYDRYSGEFVVNYETRKQWTPFASLLVSNTDFVRRSFNGTSFNGTARDNFLTRALGGLKFNYEDLLMGSIALGKEWRDYSDRAVKDVSNSSARGHITFLPKAGTILTFDFSRKTEEDNEISAGVTETRLSTELTYELQQDIFLRGFVDYEKAEFETSNREDDTYKTGIGAYYILNPRMQIGGDIFYNTRDSNTAGANYDQTRFIARLIGSL